MGGGWRQAGYLAACGIYALDHHIDRLKEDHQRAKQIGQLLAQKSYVKNVYPIETNIVIFELANELLASDFVSRMSEKELLCAGFGKHLVRFVTHLDFTDANLEALETVLNN